MHCQIYWLQTPFQATLQGNGDSIIINDYWMAVSQSKAKISHRRLPLIAVLLGLKELPTLNKSDLYLYLLFERTTEGLH